MSSKCFARGIVALILAAHGLGTANAAPAFSITGLPETAMQGESFTVVLNIDLGGDVLIALDPVVEFDTTRLGFVGYEVSGTMTDGFAVLDSLADPAVSLLQSGGILPSVQTALKARFDVLPQAPVGTASVRLRGSAGLESLKEEVEFEFSSAVTVTAVPEPSSWLMLAIGLGTLGCVGRIRKLKARAAANG